MDGVNELSAAPTPHRSLWFDQELADTMPAPPLSGRVSADVAIIGGGYVGLWTAIQLKEREPGCEVVLLERDVCGAGASGKNGGFVLSWWPKIEALVSLCGTSEALRLAQASEQAIGEIAAFCERHAIDAHFVRGGWLWSATNTAQMTAWESVLRTCERLGAMPFTRLSSDDVRSRSGSSVHRAGVLEASNATVHPGALARGLRRVALERGVRIYEQSSVRSFTRDTPSIVRTDGGRVVADTVVLAIGPWAAAIPELARALVVVSSDIVATEPAPQRLREIGWTDGVAITDAQLRVHYYRTTRDGRIVFGKGGGALALGGRIDASFDRAPTRAAETARDFRRYYPALHDVRLACDWSGAVERTPNSLPAIGHFPAQRNILHGVGWSGHGVGPSFLGGRILASLALHERDEWSGAGVVNRSMGQFPPEPLRFRGGALVQRAITRKERAEADERRPALMDRMLARLAPHE
jgi:putative aminophosphonate oxidoreductase